MGCRVRGALDDEPGTVPEDISWNEAQDRGVTPSTSVLERDEFFGAIAGTEGPQGTDRLDHIVLAGDDEAFDAITDNAHSLA